MAKSMFTMPFGIHRGEDIEDLPDTYLQWLLEQEWFVQKFPAGNIAVKKETEYRETFNRHIGYYKEEE